MSYYLIPNEEEYQIGCITQKQEEFLRNIKIQCIVKDCKFENCTENNPLYAVNGNVQLTTSENPTLSLQGTTNQSDKGLEKFNKIIFICSQHRKVNRDYYNYGNGIQIKFTNGQDNKLETKQIKQVEHIEKFNEATNKLDKESCCMRENIKFNDLKIIQRRFQLISNDDQCILSLLKDELIQKVFIIYQQKVFSDVIVIKSDKKTIKQQQCTHYLVYLFVKLMQLDVIKENLK